MRPDNLLATLVKLVEQSQARTHQKQVGPSEVGGCRRRVWHRLQGTEPCNPDTLTLASFMGTAIHHSIEAGLRDHLKAIDPWGDDLLMEIDVRVGELKGRVDLYSRSSKMVIDWKTTSKKNLRYFPSLQQRWQVQLYGWMLRENGHDVDQVCLVAIPRDGNERDVKIHVEDFNMGDVEEALWWLDQVKQSNTPPAPEKKVVFCKDYCPFFGEVCPGADA